MATLSSESQYLYLRSPNSFSFHFQNKTACFSLKIQTTNYPSVKKSQAQSVSRLLNGNCSSESDEAVVSIMFLGV